jgi:TPR repeat protein
MTKTFAAITALSVCGGISAALAQTDMNVTITATHIACQVPPPADVPPPATPSAAAGNAAVQNHNYALARANFKALSDKGDAEGERLYGNLLLMDCTGVQDKEEGVKWLGNAADAGDALAARMLGMAYMNGEGVAQDDGKAFALLTKAANAGQAPAQMSLGYLYLTGRGTPVDKYQGMVWTIKAGEQAVPQALFNIANGYFRGQALPQDNEKAVYYLSIGLQRATPQQRARVAANGNAIVGSVSGDELKRIAERARRWSPGADSLSDVLDDAKKAQKTAKN